MFHPSTTTPSVFGLPKILVTPDALHDMNDLVQLHDKEISWLGVVSPVGRCDFLIERIFLIEQTCSAAQTEMSTEGLAKLAAEILALAGGTELYNKLRFWGHSHVNMGVTPSQPDDEQMRTFIQDCDDYFIRGIFNKAGVARFDLFWIKTGIRIMEAQWELQQPARASRLDYWKSQIASKVKDPVLPQTGTQGGTHYGPRTWDPDTKDWRYDGEKTQTLSALKDTLVIGLKHRGISVTYYDRGYLVDRNNPRATVYKYLSDDCHENMTVGSDYGHDLAEDDFALHCKHCKAKWYPVNRLKAEKDAHDALTAKAVIESGVGP